MSCPSCRQPFGAILEQILDVGIDPSAKERLLSGRINLITCPFCGYRGMVGTPLMYHDPAKKLAIVYVPMELNLDPPMFIRINFFPFRTDDDSGLPRNPDDGSPPAADPPIADAGADESVAVGARVTLDGSGSSSPDGEILVYYWEQVDGPTVTLSDADSASATFVPSVAGAYVFALTVENANGDDVDQVRITAIEDEDGFTSNAGPDQSVYVGVEVTLDGSGSRTPPIDSGSRGGPHSEYSFAWTQLSGPAVTLEDADAATARFTPVETGAYTFELAVSDGSTVRYDDVLVEVLPLSNPGAGTRVDPISSTFDVDDEGWSVTGGSFAESVLPPRWESEGGVPGGHLSAIGRGAWYWVAPEKFRGDLRGAYALKFDLNQSFLNGSQSQSMVVLQGGGLSLHYPVRFSAGVTWTGYSIHFDEYSGWLNANTGDPASRAEILTALAAVQQLKIRGWYQAYGGDGEGGLDNVEVVFTSALKKLAFPVNSTFDTGADGWTVAGGGFDRSGIVEWHAADGVPGGHIAAHSNGDWFWIAPPKFRGDASAAYGAWIKFTINQSFLNGANFGRIILNGGGYSIAFNAPYVPLTTWTSFSVHLQETELWYHTGTSERVSRDVLRDVLSDLRMVKIRGWYSNYGGRAPVASITSSSRSIPRRPPRPAASNHASTRTRKAGRWPAAPSSAAASSSGAPVSATAPGASAPLPTAPGSGSPRRSSAAICQPLTASRLGLMCANPSPTASRTPGLSSSRAVATRSSPGHPTCPAPPGPATPSSCWRRNCGTTSTPMTASRGTSCSPC